MLFFFDGEEFILELEEVVNDKVRWKLEMMIMVLVMKLNNFLLFVGKIILISFCFIL